VIVFSLCIYFSTPKIQNSLSKEVAEIMRARGFDRIMIRASGRDIILVGNVSSDSAALSALNFAASGWGVRKVSSELELKPLRLPHLVFQRNIDGGINVTGEVPRQNDVEKILEIIQRYSRGSPVQYSVAANPEVTDPNWIELVDAVLQESEQIGGLEFEIGAGQISIGGLIPNEPSYAVFLKRIKQFIFNFELELINGVGINPSDNVIADYYDDYQNSLDVSNKEELPLVDSELNSQLVKNKDKDKKEVEKSVEKVTLKSQVQIDSLSETSIAGGQIEEDGISEGNENNNFEELVGGKNKQICQIKINESVLQEPIVFPSGSIALSVDNSTSIDNISKILDLCPTYSVLIKGHTDSDGQEASNLLLSQLRAESVMNWLVERGIDINKIKATGFGSVYPVASNETVAGKRLNRRIEIQLD
jgi:outer membrane protein OmpA-like peptidoglycan-associated protein